MRWFLYLLSLTAALFIGYIFGNQSQVLIVDTTEKLPANCEILSAQPPSFIFPEQIPSSSSCQCNENIQCPTINNADNTSSLSHLFSELINNADYVQAMSLYHTVWSVSQSDATGLHQLLVEHIKQLIKHPKVDYERVNDAIDTYLSDFYDDIYFLLLKARTHISQKLFFEAINTYQLASNYSYTDRNQGVVQKDYRKFMSFLRNTYNQNQQWQELIDIYLHAESAGLLSDHDRLHLIELYLKTGNRYQAQANADLLLDNPEWEEQLSVLLGKTKEAVHGDKFSQRDESNTDYDSVINLKKVNNQYVIPILLSDEEVTLLIDTGASITTISEEFYKKIKRSVNMKYKTRTRFLTANGRTTGEVYTVDTLTIGPFVLNNIDVAVLDYPTSRHSSGLLGMNVLQQFQFKIDQQDVTLKLTKP